MCKQVCDIIPRNFKDLYYSLWYFTYSSRWKKDEIFANILDKIQTYLDTDPRILDSNFQIEPLDFGSISIQSDPYIIIDMAHLFKYVVDDISSYNITRAFI